MHHDYTIWITTIKFLGIAIAAALGVIGILKDTHDSDHNRLTGAGRLMIAGIVSASVVAAVGQAIEAHQQSMGAEVADIKRREELRLIEDTAHSQATIAANQRAMATEQQTLRDDARRQSLPFGSRFLASGQLSIDLDDTILKPYQSQLETAATRTESRGRTITLSRKTIAALAPLFRSMAIVVMIDGAKGKYLNFVLQDFRVGASVGDGTINLGRLARMYINIPRNTLSVEFAAVVEIADNERMASLLDFGGCSVNARIIGTSRDMSLDVLSIQDGPGGLSLFLYQWERQPPNPADAPTVGRFALNIQADVTPHTFGGWM